jgi:glyoxylase-like metal-dependent hydrolase (beta-lactamase superfamily II)
MGIKIDRLVLGPLENNTYLVTDRKTAQSVVIDPSFGSVAAAREIQRSGYHLSAIWLTHAHFDHLAGIQELQAEFHGAIPVGLHPADLPLWNRAGDAAMFGFQVKPGPEPHIRFNHGQRLQIGESTIEVRHTPGHCAGHVVFYAAEDGVVFCGDLIFQMGVGRTDLPGGDDAALVESIRSQIFPLPPQTRLLSGHGAETTVGVEKASNPYVGGEVPGD